MISRRSFIGGLTALGAVLTIPTRRARPHLEPSGLTAEQVRGVVAGPSTLDIRVLTAEIEAIQSEDGSVGYLFSLTRTK